MFHVYKSKPVKKIFEQWISSTERIDLLRLGSPAELSFMFISNDEHLLISIDLCSFRYSSLLYRSASTNVDIVFVVLMCKQSNLLFAFPCAISMEKPTNGNYSTDTNKNNSE